MESALEISDRFLSGSGAAAAAAWAQFQAADRHALTASLARLLLRARVLEPLLVQRSSQLRYDAALRQVEAACHTDYMFSAMNGLLTGQGLAGDLSGPRDRPGSR